MAELFGGPNNNPFTGITVIAVGDLLQLPPIRSKPIYPEYKKSWQNLDLLWDIFNTAELIKVMKQRGDNEFINHV